MNKLFIIYDDDDELFKYRVILYDSKKMFYNAFEVLGAYHTITEATVDLQKFKKIK